MTITRLKNTCFCVSNQQQVPGRVVGSRSFCIVDKKNKIVFQLDALNRTYQFFNRVLEQEAQEGILILPISRNFFEGRSRVQTPGRDNSISFDLFAKTMRYFFQQQLRQDGFKLLSHSLLSQ